MTKYIFVFLLMFSTNLNSASVTYYIDSRNGDDMHDGTSIRQCWKTLEKVSSVVLMPGDKVLLKRDELFNGFLDLKGYGSMGAPITIGSYGIGKRPLINSENNPYAIRLLNASNWVISDLETTGGNLAGIFIGCTRDGMVLENLRILNCYVHHIGDTTKFDWVYSKSTGGIIVVNGTFDDKGIPVFYNSVFNNVTIEDCTVEYNHRWTCISISSGKLHSLVGNLNRIRNCTVAWSSADGIRMNGVKNSFIEYCVLYKNGAWPDPRGRNLGGLGAWFFDAENCTIQYCESSWVGATTTDGGAFDIDYWQKNSTVQYCYGHHCAGYGVSVFGADPTFPTENSVVRYNIFANNGRDSSFAFQGDFFVFTWNGGLLNGVKIHDNISYWDPAVPAPSLKFDALFSGNKKNTFTRNTIYSPQPWLVEFRNDSLQCDSNLYWTGQTPKWEMKNESFASLSDWQRITGLDGKSRMRSENDKGEITGSKIIVPQWHKAELPGIPFMAKTKQNTVNVGDPVPELFLKTTPTLIVFISSQCNKRHDYEVNLIQLNFIKSMIRQYAGQGFRVIVIDESLASGCDASPYFESDHLIDDMVWIKDDYKATLAQKFGVSQFPSTYLISNGKIAEIWQGLALPAQTAFAIEDLLKFNKK